MSKLLDTMGCITMLITSLCLVGIGICLVFKTYIDWLSVIFPDEVMRYIAFVATLFILGLMLYLLSKIIIFLKRRRVKKEWKKTWS